MSAPGTILKRGYKTVMIMSEELYQRALEKWGEEAQIDKSMEESAELIAALAKRMNGFATEQDVIDEIADMSVMVKQLRLMFGPDEVDAQVAREKERLERMLEGDR